MHTPTYACEPGHTPMRACARINTHTLILSYACCTNLSQSSPETDWMTFIIHAFCSSVIVRLCRSLQTETIFTTASQGCHSRVLQTRQGKHRKGCGHKARVWRSKTKCSRATLPLSFPGESPSWPLQLLVALYPHSRVAVLPPSP